MIRIVVHLCLTFCFLVEETSGAPNITRLQGDPWVEDHENGSLPVMVLCQALSPPSFNQPSWQLPCRKSQSRCTKALQCMGTRCDGHYDCINVKDEPSPWGYYSVFRGGHVSVLKEPKELKDLQQHTETYQAGRNQTSQQDEASFERPFEHYRTLRDSAVNQTFEYSGFAAGYFGAPHFQPSGLTQKLQSRVEKTLDLNTWLLIIILLLLALVLGKRVFKKIYSWLKVAHPGDVEETRLEDQERTVRTEEKFGTDDTDIMEESALLLNYDDESPELNQQVCTTETKGAYVHRGDLPCKVEGDLVVYVNMNTVNMNTMSMNMNTTNNVELQQNGGVTVVGDKTNINYHQPPQ